MNLMIVEDEIRLLNSIANNIPWETYGIDVVGMASDGAQALSLIERKNPDIIIMDIVMPEIDGLTLTKMILRHMPDTQIIILSGHDDFQYAQKAIELGVFKYLLKPTGDTEIIKAVLEASAAARSTLETRHNLQVLQRKWVEHLPRLRDDFLRNWISDKYSAWEISRYSEELSLRLSANQQYCVAVAEIDPLLRNEKRFANEDLPLLQFSLQSIAQELLGSAAFVFQDRNGSTVLIFSAMEQETSGEFIQRINQYAMRVITVTRECLKVTASAGIGSTCKGEFVSLSYKQARIALQERVILGYEIVVPYREQPKSNRVMDYQRELDKNIQIALELREKEQAVETILQTVTVHLQLVDTLSAFQEYVLYLQSLFIRTIHLQGWSLLEVLGEDFTYLQSIQSIHTKEQLLIRIQDFVTRYMSYREKQSNSGTHELIKGMLALIEKSMDQEITLHTVADKLYVNSSYLSRLFKREIGKPFSEYVVEQKMKRAKEMLQTGLKVSDAARMTGYRDTSYFIKLFRKFWGVTPGELKTRV